MDTAVMERAKTTLEDHWKNHIAFVQQNGGIEIFVYRTDERLIAGPIGYGAQKKPQYNVTVQHGYSKTVHSDLSEEDVSRILISISDTVAALRATDRMPDRLGILSSEDL